MEAAICLPVFFLLIFGIFEFGLLFKTSLTVDDIARNGGRAATVAGKDADADYRIVQAAAKAATALNNGSLQMLVVFKATSVTDDFSSATFASCRAGTAVTGLCNVYLPADLARPSTDFGCGGTSPDRFWCPTTRKVARTGTGGPPDYIGIYAKASHTQVSGLLGSNKTLTDESIMRLEPVVHA